MSTDLAGNNLEEALTTSSDSDEPYVNTGVLAKLTLLMAEPDETITEPEDAISGPISVVLVGDQSSTLTLSGANSYSGGTFLESGVLQVGAVGALGTGGVAFSKNAAELEAAVSMTLNVVVDVEASATATFAAADGQTLTLQGLIELDGAQTHFGTFLTVEAGGTIILAPISSLSNVNPGGAVSVDDGTLVIGNSLAATLIGALQGGLTVGGLATLDLDGQNVTAFNLAGDSPGSITDSAAGSSCTLTVEGTADSVFGGSISNGAGTVALELDGNDGVTLTLNGFSSYSGGTTIDSGTLVIQRSGSLGSGSLTFVGSDTTLLATAGFNLENAIDVDLDVSATIGEAHGFSLALDSTQGLDFDGGAGTILHFGSATETGAIYLTPLSDKVQVAAGSAFAVDGGFLLTGNAEGAAMISDFAQAIVGTGITHSIFDLDGQTVTLHNLTGNHTGTVQNTGAHTVLTLDDTSSTTFAGSIVGGPNGLSVVVAGSHAGLTLVGTNDYTGGTTIDAGSRLSIGAGGTAGSILGNATDNGTLVFDRSDVVTFSGKISGTGSVEQLGSGTTRLSGANTFDGVTLAAGTLDLASTTAAGASTSTIAFASHFAQLRIEHGDSPVNKIAGLAAGDSIVLVGVLADTAAVIASTNQLVLKKGTATVATLHLSGTTAGLTFSTRVTAAGTTVYVDANVANYASLKAKLDLAPSGFAIVGTAAAIAAGFATLSTDTNLALAIVSDNAPLALSASVAAAGAGAISKLRNANGSAASVAITDTAANLEASLHALASHVAQVASITLTGSAVPTFVVTAALAQTYKPLLNKIQGLWLLAVNAAHGNGFSLVGTAAALSAKFATFGADQNLTGVTISDNAPLHLSASVAAKSVGALAKLHDASGSAGAVAIADSVADVHAALSTLLAQAAHVASITFTDKSAPILGLTATLAKSYTPLLNKIAGPWLLDVQNVDRSWTTTGHGNGLTIADIPGTDVITGGGASETFVLKPGFGHASILDFDKHLTGAAHDTVVLQKSEFADFGALLHDATTSKLNLGIDITAHGDTLFLEGMTQKMLTAAAADFKFG